MLAHTLSARVGIDGQVTDLIGQGLLGSQEAFIKLDAMFRPAVVDFLRKACGNHWLADELANETFLRAYQALAKYRGKSRAQFQSFLFSIASNLLKDHFRGRSRRAAGPVEWLGWQDPNDCIESDKYSERNGLEAKERRAMLAEALNSLPADQAKLVRLSHLKQLNAEKIAEILGKPSPEAVRAALCRAMKNLRAALVRQGYFDQVSA